MSTNVVVNGGAGGSSFIDSDEVVYHDCPKPPEPEPKPDKDCCCKTYTVVLHFH